MLVTSECKRYNLILKVLQLILGSVALCGEDLTELLCILLWLCLKIKVFLLSSFADFMYDQVFIPVLHYLVFYLPFFSGLRSSV